MPRGSSRNSKAKVGADVAAPVEPGSAFHLEALGSGSDYTPFVQHVGLAAMNLGFSGEPGNGSCHSIFDSFDKFTRFKDSTFAYGLTLAKTAGRIVLRFADADVLPYAFAPSADTIARYAREVAKLVDDERKATLKRNALIADGNFTFAADPRETFVAPTKRDEVPAVDFTALNDAVTRSKKERKPTTPRSALRSPRRRLQVPRLRRIERSWPPSTP